MKIELKTVYMLLICAAALCGQTYNLTIQPGGMASDVVVTDMAEYQHQEVTNLRINKRGEWTAVPGYVTVEGYGLASLKNAIEIFDDVSKSRFLVLYMADSLSRLNYPYSSIYTKPEKISLPTGVTIDSTKDMYFSYNNGVLRISGAVSQPVWYGYVKRNLFTSAAPNGVIIYDWQVLKTALQDTLNIQMMEYDPAVLHQTWSQPLGRIQQFTEPKSYSIHHFEIYDQSQYNPDFSNNLYYMASTSTSNELDTWWQVCIRVNHGPSTWPNNRISGTGIVVKNNEGAYHIANFLDFSANLDSVRYVRRAKVYNDTCLALSYNDELAYLNLNDGYLYSGEKVTLSTTHGTVTDAVVDSIIWDPIDDAADHRMLVFFDRSLAALSQTSYGWVTVTCKRNWVYDGTGWITSLPIDLTNEAVEFYDYTGIPAGTSGISCNYKMMEIIDGKSYVASSAAGEGGYVRYSPLYQYDVLPNINIIQTRGSDLDEDITIQNRDGRLVILNKYTIEQGSVANQYSRDIAFVGNGLYAAKGYLLNDNILYVMDREDLYQFDGNVFRPFMTNSFMRNFYRDNVDTTGFLAYDKLNRELVVQLNDTSTIVFQFDYNSWYKRESDLSGLEFGLMDHSGRLLLADSDKLVTWNHSDTTYGEQLEWSFTTKINRASDAGDISQFLYLYMYVEATDSVKVTIKDDNQTRTYIGKYLPAAIMTSKMLRPRYWFRDMDIKVENIPDSQNQGSAIIRRAIATIWK